MKLPNSFKVLSILLLLMAGCSEISSVRTLRLGHGLDVTHPVHQGMLQIDHHLQKLSDGKMRLVIYPK